MLFNSLEFLIFFPTVTAVYFLLPYKNRWLWLLIASCFFYMAFVPVYILILFFVVLIDFYAAIFIEKSTGTKRKNYLILSIISTCAVLFVFKYYNFFNDSFSGLFTLLGISYSIPALDIILPIGLSFHTFQSLSYVIEVYRGHHPAEKKLGMYSLYVMFFPQLVAGPIERPQNLVHQFYEKHDFDYERVVDGLYLIAWGLFKKIVIADRLAIFVNVVFDDVVAFDGIHFIIATIFFAFQIYCDFSGYSDIAIGVARILGFDLMRNFRQPYLARSFTEFWQRWHISLSTWFRDYLYIPLGGNRVSRPRWYGNLFITFLISGLWHGANWTYVVWGFLNGIYIILELMTSKLRQKMAQLLHLNRLPNVISDCIKVVFIFLMISFSWIFFRSKNIHDAFYVVKKIGADFGNSLNLLMSGDFSLFFIKDAIAKITYGNSFVEFYLCIVLIIFLTGIQLLQQSYGSIRDMIRSQNFYLRWGVYYCVVFAIVISICFGGVYEEPFIYFQF